MVTMPHDRRWILKIQPIDGEAVLVFPEALDVKAGDQLEMKSSGNGFVLSKNDASKGAQS